MPQKDALLTRLLPEEFEGWVQTGEDRVYTPDTLYEYLNGGAELYLSYGFKKVLRRTYTRLGEPALVVDVFDMGTSENAFGVFSHSREVVDRTVGQGSQYTEGLMLFWKDCYYVSILSYPETAESKRAVIALAHTIDRAIPREGPLPALIKLLPKDSLLEESIRYFRHPTWLNLHYFIADQNILHLNEETEALMARYGTPGETSVLLLVHYKDNEAADHAYRSFVDLYLPELTTQPIVRIEDGTWTGAQVYGKLFIAVFNAAQEEKVSHLIEEVKEVASRQNNPTQGKRKQ